MPVIQATYLIVQNTDCLKTKFGLWLSCKLLLKHNISEVVWYNGNCYWIGDWDFGNSFLRKQIWSDPQDQDLRNHRINLQSNKEINQVVEFVLQYPPFLFIHRSSFSWSRGWHKHESSRLIMNLLVITIKYMLKTLQRLHIWGFLHQTLKLVQSSERVEQQFLIFSHDLMHEFSCLAIMSIFQEQLIELLWCLEHLMKFLMLLDLSWPS